MWSPRGRAERRWKGPLGKFTEDRTIGDLTQQSPNAPPRQTITGSQTRAHTHIHTHVLDSTVLFRKTHETDMNNFIALFSLFKKCANLGSEF